MSWPARMCVCQQCSVFPKGSGNLVSVYTFVLAEGGPQLTSQLHALCERVRAHLAQVQQGGDDHARGGAATPHLQGSSKQCCPSISSG